MSGDIIAYASRRPTRRRSPFSWGNLSPFRDRILGRILPLANWKGHSIRKFRRLAKFYSHTATAEQVMTLDGDGLHARAVYADVIQGVENAEGQLAAAHKNCYLGPERPGLDEQQDAVVGKRPSETLRQVRSIMKHKTRPWRPMNQTVLHAPLLIGHLGRTRLLRLPRGRNKGRREHNTREPPNLASPCQEQSCFERLVLAEKSEKEGLLDRNGPISQG